MQWQKNIEIWYCHPRSSSIRLEICTHAYTWTSSCPPLLPSHPLSLLSYSLVSFPQFYSPYLWFPMLPCPPAVLSRTLLLPASTIFSLHMYILWIPCIHSTNVCVGILHCSNISVRPKKLTAHSVRILCSWLMYSFTALAEISQHLLCSLSPGLCLSHLPALLSSP